MIDPNKCQVCYPIVAQIVEMKFESEKETRKCVLRAWKECDRPADVHTTELVDPTNPNTQYTLHRCAQHVEELRVQKEANERAKQEK